LTEYRNRIKLHTNEVTTGLAGLIRVRFNQEKKDLTEYRNRIKLHTNEVTTGLAGLTRVRFNQEKKT